MNPNETRTLWISVGAALFSVFLLYSWSQEQKTAMAQKFGATKRIVIAKEPITEMETILESKLDYIDLPIDFVQPSAATEPEEVVGQVAAAPIQKGEQILHTKLYMPGPDTGLAMEVTPGKRAITLPIDDMRGVSKLLRPGDRIDIIAALDHGKGADAKREVRTILQDVVVLSTGFNIVNKIPRRFEKDGNGNVSRINMIGDTNFSTITIEAKPEEVQHLVYILATTPGSLFTTLRHPNDRHQAPLHASTVEDILNKPQVRGIAAAPAVAAPMPAPVPIATPERPKPQKRKRGGFEEL